MGYSTKMARSCLSGFTRLLARSLRLGFSHIVARSVTLGFSGRTARSSQMGYSVYMARSSQMGYSSSLARSFALDYSCVLARSSILGFSTLLARSTRLDCSIVSARSLFVGCSKALARSLLSGFLADHGSNMQKPAGEAAPGEDPACQPTGSLPMKKRPLTLMDPHHMSIIPHFLHRVKSPKCPPPQSRVRRGLYLCPVGRPPPSRVARAWAPLLINPNARGKGEYL